MKEHAVSDVYNPSPAEVPMTSIELQPLIDLILAAPPLEPK